MGVEELRERRALIVADVRAKLALVAEMFSGMVAIWAAEFCTSLEVLSSY